MHDSFAAALAPALAPARVEFILPVGECWRQPPWHGVCVASRARTATRIAPAHGPKQRLSVLGAYDQNITPDVLAEAWIGMEEPLPRPGCSSTMEAKSTAELSTASELGFRM